MSDSKIPYFFTDAGVKYEVEKLVSTITGAMRESDALKLEMQSVKKKLDDYSNTPSQPIATTYDDVFRQDRGMLMAKIAQKEASIKEGYLLQDDASKIKKRVEKLKRQEAELMAKKQELENLLLIPAEQRVENHYQRLLREFNRLKTLSTHNAGSDLRRQAQLFREISGYKNANEIASECDNLYREHEEQKKREKEERTYNDLIQKKNSASTEADYLDLVEKFRGMNDYRESAKFADECYNKYYDQLVLTKNKATTEREYTYLQEKFRAMNGYKDSVKIAAECDNQYKVLKEHREKLEREREAEQKKQVTRKAIARVTALVLAVISMISFVIYLHMDELSLDVLGNIDSGMMIFRISLVFAPFLLMFFLKSIGWKIGCSASLIPAIAPALEVGRVDTGIVPFIVFCVFYVISCTMTWIFPKSKYTFHKPVSSRYIQPTANQPLRGKPRHNKKVGSKFGNLLLNNTQKMEKLAVILDLDCTAKYEVALNNL
ncbi:MAG: hypothetical protein FWD47_13525 [Treponema sp.]|nr:hypothetical protein [Treponema sp.]